MGEKEEAGKEKQLACKKEIRKERMKKEKWWKKWRETGEAVAPKKGFDRELAYNLFNFKKKSDLEALRESAYRESKKGDPFSEKERVKERWAPIMYLTI